MHAHTHIIPFTLLNISLIISPYVMSFFVHRQYFNVLLTLSVFFATVISSMSLIYLINGIPF